MAEPFLSEIRLMSFGFPPKGWALCDGQLLPINQNQGLFSLLGTTYGGDGRVNFGLPNLKGNVPIHMGPGFSLGQKGGEPAHTLSISEIPTHTHALNVSSIAVNGNANPANRFLGGANNAYTSPQNLTAINTATVGNTGGSQAHLNMQPFLTLSFCIALQGIFPSQT